MQVQKPSPYTVRRFRGFTLVELLVVIGIIALLIAILLPALRAAREQANMIKCLASLRSMAQAAHAHAAEHRGFMPVSGRVLTKASPGPLGDVNRLRYTYIDNGGTVEALPLTAALGNYMSVPWKYSTASDVTQALKTDDLQRHFRCPSQDNPKPGWTLYDSNGWCYGWDEYSSYIFNGYVLTVGKSPTGAACPGGQVTQVRLPSEVFLFADGNNTEGGETGYEVYGDVWTNESNLYEGWQRCFSFGRFDHTRHRNRMNVVFVDGHAQTVNMPDPKRRDDPSNRGDFDTIGLTRGIVFR